jgi:hypothetical protein
MQARKDQLIASPVESGLHLIKGYASPPSRIIGSPCQAASAADLSSGSLSFLALAALRPLGGLAAFRAFAARHTGRPGETCPAAHDVHACARDDGRSLSPAK